MVNDEAPKPEKEENLTLWKNPVSTFIQLMKTIFTNLTVEPLLFLHAFSYGLAGIAIPSLYFDKICLVICTNI